MDKIKVVWICHLSNSQIKEHLSLRIPLLQRVIRHILHKPFSLTIPDFAQWNTNAIREFEKFNDINLHIIAPYNMLQKKNIRFELNGIQYYFFRNQDSSLYSVIHKKLIGKYHCSYKQNRKCIVDLVNSIKPDIIHLIGAENLQYSLSLLDLPKNIPSIVQLQTLVNDPKFKNDYYHGNNKLYEYIASGERKVIKNADYVGSTVDQFKTIINSTFNFKVKFLDTTLALTESVNLLETKKEFDFVYFAVSINKAVDLAIEAFALVYRQFPTLSLDIVGGYESTFKASLDQRIEELGLSGSITFEGRLPSHEDVINQIRKSRFALLPLKVDIISGTIRESMANGLPVVTTITSGTPALNENEECVLLSTIGDHQMMAENMIKLIESDDFANMIRNNAAKKATERGKNYDFMVHWKDAYKAILKNRKTGKPIPNSF